LQVDDITGLFLSSCEPPYSLMDGALAQRRKPEDEFIARRVPQIVAPRTRQLYAIRDCALLEIRFRETHQHMHSRLVARHLGSPAEVLSQGL